jgi:hypothetical protein
MLYCVLFFHADNTHMHAAECLWESNIIMIFRHSHAMHIQHQASGYEKILWPRDRIALGSYFLLRSTNRAHLPGPKCLAAHSTCVTYQGRHAVKTPAANSRMRDRGRKRLSHGCGTSQSPAARSLSSPAWTRSRNSTYDTS